MCSVNRWRNNAPSMDARVAKALRNSPHRIELKYLFLLSHVQDETLKREIIRERLPSLRILSETVRRFMCVGSDYDRQAALLLRRYPVAALLTHSALVHGLIVLMENRAVQVQIHFERFLDTTLLEMRRLRELTPSQLFDPPASSTASSLPSVSSLASLQSVAGGFATSTPCNSPTLQVLERVRHRLENLHPRELFPPEEAIEHSFEALSQISWRSVREKFQERLNDDERHRNVTMEEDLDLTMSSINSQDRMFQRDYFNVFMLNHDLDSFPDMEDIDGFGTPFLQPGLQQNHLDLATPLPLEDEDDPLRPQFRIVEIPDENQPLPSGEDLERIFKQEFDKEVRLSQLPKWQPQDVPQSSPQPSRPLVLHEEGLSPISHPPGVEPSEPGPSVTTPVVIQPSVAKPSWAEPAVAGPSWAYPAIAGPSWAEPAVAGPSWAYPAIPGPSSATPAMTTGDVPSVAGPSIATVPSVSGPTLNPSWGTSFPIYVDEPEPDRPQPPVVPDPAKRPSSPSSPQPVPFSEILGPADPDHPVFEYPFPGVRGNPLEDITRHHQPPPAAPPKPKRKLGKLTSRLHYQTTKLWFHSKKVRNHIRSRTYKKTDPVSKRIKKITEPEVINLDGGQTDPGDWCPRSASMPVFDASGIFRPLDTAGLDEEEELMSNDFDNLSIECDDDESWETIDEDEDELNASWERAVEAVALIFPPEDYPLTFEDLMDRDWLFKNKTDAFHYQEMKEGEPSERNLFPRFPPKFRYKRAPLVSYVVLRYYPNWESLRHPSELPPPQPGLDAIGPQAVDTAATSSISGKLMQTDSVTSKSGPSVDLPAGTSSLEAHTFSSLIKKPSLAVSDEDTRLRVDSIQTVSSGALGLSALPELGETTVIMQPQEEAVGTEQAQGAAGPQTEQQAPQKAVGPQIEEQVVAGPLIEVQAPQEAAGQVAEEQVAEGGVAISQQAEFQFAVPGPVVRPRRVRAVQVRYRESDDEDEYEPPPRRRKRRRPRRVQEVEGEPVPPAAALPEEVGQIEMFPPPFVDVQVEQSEAVQEPEPPKVWEPDRVRTLLRNKIIETGDMVLRFSDLCELGVCSRKSAASFFSALLVLDAEKVINLRQTDNTGHPANILIEADYSLLNED